jgi:hypothetical protein
MITSSKKIFATIAITALTLTMTHAMEESKEAPATPSTLEEKYEMLQKKFDAFERHALLGTLFSAALLPKSHSEDIKILKEELAQTKKELSFLKQKVTGNKIVSIGSNLHITGMITKNSALSCIASVVQTAGYCWHHIPHDTFSCCTKKSKKSIKDTPAAPTMHDHND